MATPETNVETVETPTTPAVTFKGNSYNVTQAMFDQMRQMVALQYPGSLTVQDNALESMLKAFLKPSKGYAGIARQEALDKQAEVINGDPVVKPARAKLARMFKGYSDGANELESVFGGKPQLTVGGTLILVLKHADAAKLPLSTVFENLGDADMSYFTNEDTGPMVKFKGEAPTLSKQKADYLAAKGELDEVIRKNHEIGDGVVIAWDPEKQAIKLQEKFTPTSNGTGAHGGGNTNGAVTKGGSVKYVPTGKVYTGTHQEIYDAVIKDGIKLFSGAKPSHILGGKCGKNFQIIERK